MKDLEKSIELARKHEELFGIRKREECCVAACQEMAEWKEQHMIEKACEWIAENVGEYEDLYYDVGGFVFPEFRTEQFINDFKKAMKGGGK